MTLVVLEVGQFPKVLNFSGSICQKPAAVVEGSSAFTCPPSYVMHVKSGPSAGETFTGKISTSFGPEREVSTAKASAAASSSYMDSLYTEPLEVKMMC